MNILTGTIATVTVQNNLSLIRVDVGSVPLSAIVIDTPESAPYLAPGRTIQVLFKETEVILGKGTDHRISLQNRLVGSVSAIEQGELLSKLTLETTVGRVVSIITTPAVRQLQLQTGTEVTAMIKTNEMMLSECTNR